MCNYEVDGPVVSTSLRIKDRFKQRDFSALLSDFFAYSSQHEPQKRRAVVVVSHSGTISNMLFSHTAKKEEQVLHGKCILKPRNASVIAIYDDGCLGLRHEGTLPKSKSDELHEYFTVPQFEQFAHGVQFQYTPPSSCLLLLVRHGIAVNNVNKAFTDGNLTHEGEVSMIKAALRISHLLQQHDIASVGIFSSACMRTQHSSMLLYQVLQGSGLGGLSGHRPGRLMSSRSLPCLTTGLHNQGQRHGGRGGEGEGCGDEPWLKGAIPVGHPSAVGKVH